MPMLYGAMNFPVRPILKELEMIARLGFDYMELTMDPPQAHYRMVQSQKEKIMQALEGFKMGIICHLPTFVSTADLTQSIREVSLEEVVESLDVAAELCPLKVVLHPSYIGGLGIFVMDQASQYAIKSLEAVVERAERLGVVLCIENMFPGTHWLTDPDDFVDIFERFPTLQLTLDTGHAHINAKGGKKNTEFIERFSDRIHHIHANDNFGKEDNHLPLGAGTIDFPKIAKALKKIGYDKTITLEVFSQDRDYVKISKEKIASMIEAS